MPAMKCWLRQKIKIIKKDVRDAFIFGSSITDGAVPSDVDVVVVAEGTVGTYSWWSVRAFREDVRSDFQSVFGLRLSMMVVTPSEWKQIDGSIVRERVSLL